MLSFHVEQVGFSIFFLTLILALILQTLTSLTQRLAVPNPHLTMQNTRKKFGIAVNVCCFPSMLVLARAQILQKDAIFPLLLQEQKEETCLLENPSVVNSSVRWGPEPKSKALKLSKACHEKIRVSLLLPRGAGQGGPPSELQTQSWDVTG